MCNLASKFHLKAKSSKDHQLISISKQNPIQQYLRLPLHCTSHKEKVVTLYCLQDGCMVCTICLSEAHRDHKCCLIEEDYKTRVITEWPSLQEEISEVLKENQKHMDGVEALRR